MTVRSLESFEVPALLGLQNGIYVFTSQIYFALRSYPPDLAGAGALALGLLAIAVVGVILSNRVGKDSKNFQTVTGKGFRPRPMELGRFRPVAGGAHHPVLRRDRRRAARRAALHVAADVLPRLRPRPSAR